MENLGDLEKKISEASESFDELDRCQEIRDLSAEECKQMKEAKARIWQLKKVKDSYNFQNTGIQWIREGDANFSFSIRGVALIRLTG